MAIGPVQLLAIGFYSQTSRARPWMSSHDSRESNAVRVIDALVVYKDADGDLAVAQGGNLSQDESVEFGAKVGALIGLGAAGEEGFAEGAELGAMAGEDGIQIFSDDTALDLIEALPNDSAVALVLIEHHWAVPLRDAVWRAGGFNLASRFIRPRDLVELGLVKAEEVESLRLSRTSRQPTPTLRAPLSKAVNRRTRTKEDRHVRPADGSTVRRVRRLVRVGRRRQGRLRRDQAAPRHRVDRALRRCPVHQGGRRQGQDPRP